MGKNISFVEVKTYGCYARTAGVLRLDDDDDDKGVSIE